MEANEFRCSYCGGIFEKGWSDEDAMDECKETFGELAEMPLAVICDDCYKKLITKIANYEK